MIDGTFNGYQQSATETAIYPGQGTLEGVNYAVLGVNGEAGEIAEKLKKMYRDDGVLTDERRAAMLKEVGDELWYLAQLCTELGAKMGDVAADNIRKLWDRKERGALSGDGDDR